MLDLSPWYDGREQSYVKHYVLQQYLARFARIIGTRWSSITYIDSFAGPWKNRHPDLLDTSFAIATDRLREARDWVDKTLNRRLQIRCLFLEKTKASFVRLDTYARALTDIEAEALNEPFESAVPRVLEFINRSNETFTFLFIDPTGWTEFSLDVIAPLLRRQPNEILINFMTGHIRRFLESETSQASFVRLFGRDIRAKLEGLDGDAREEKALGEYMRSLKRAGKYLYVGSAIVLKPEIDTPQFHLIYATRHNKGVAVFKDVEQKMLPVAADARGVAKERRRLAETGQASFLPPRDPSTTIEVRRARYREMAREKVRDKLMRARRLRYEVLWRMALAFPLVWTSDVRSWIDEWKRAGEIAIPTQTGRRRVPDPEIDEIHWVGQT